MFILRTAIFSSFLTSEPQSFLQMCEESMVAADHAASALPCPAAPAAQLKVIGSSWAFIYGMVEQINYGIR